MGVPYYNSSMMGPQNPILIIEAPIVCRRSYTPSIGCWAPWNFPLQMRDDLDKEIKDQAWLLYSV